MTVVLIQLACMGHNLQSGEGFIEVPGGKIWYEVVGSGKAIPLILLHGGPGYPSFYLEPLKALASDRPVIFYDQLGCGRSDQPQDTTLWTTERYVQELHLLREALGLDEVYILGHSWGGTLAMEYILSHPSGVKALIMSSPFLSISRWIGDTDSLIATLPDSLQEFIRIHQQAGTTDSEEYLRANNFYLNKFVSRYSFDSRPAYLDSAEKYFGAHVYNYMWGPSEFEATGTLRNYERIDQLPSLNVPTLFTAGRYDEATPRSVEYFANLVPNSQFIIFENSAHMTMITETEAYLHAISDFLKEIE